MYSQNNFKVVRPMSVYRDDDCTSTATMVPGQKDAKVLSKNEEPLSHFLFHVVEHRGDNPVYYSGGIAAWRVSWIVVEHKFLFCYQ